MTLAGWTQSNYAHWRKLSKTDVRGQIQAELARRTLTDYKRHVWKRYQHAPHLDALDRLLEQCSLHAATGGERGIGHLIVEMPPRMGKTTTISRLFPTWHLGKHPDHRIILASYGASLAEKNSRYARNVLMLPRYQAVFPGVALDMASRAADAWDLAAPHEGGLDAIGVGGGVTGKGGHIVIVDDPVKSRAEAESETYREKVWDWFTDDLYTRREPGAAVIVVMCMTGDTPVLMADGTNCLLRDLQVGDLVATYDEGKLRTSRVLNHGRSGRDYTYEIMTSSGKMVRANERHPFLVEAHGELKWTRLKDLNTGHKIVTLKDNGASGKARLAPLRVATDQSVVGDTALLTTTRKNGLMARVRRQVTRPLAVMFASSNDTALRRPSTMHCLLRKAVNVLSASSHLEITSAPIGAGSYASTMTTRQIRSGHSCATTATLLSDTLRPKQTPSLLPNTSDFTTEQIVSITPTGIEEVFDVQIDRTENLIANGLVSHNTRWHQDDLAGRLLNRQPGVWTRLRMPALAEPDDDLERIEGAALWPDRYPLRELTNIRATLGEYSWSALYQQRPVPAEGGLFKRAAFHLIPRAPEVARAVRYWDLAMSDRTSADYTVGVLLGQTEAGRLVVLDVARAQLDWSSVPSFMAETALRDGPDVALGFEEKGYMSRAGQELAQDSRLHNFSIWGFPKDKDKLTNALPFAARVGQGLVDIVEGHWAWEFIDELCSFPAGEHDDQVDAASGAYGMLGTIAGSASLTYADEYTIGAGDF